MTEYQSRVAREINQERRAAVTELKKMGAVARIGYVHYEGMHTNVCTIEAVDKAGHSRCVKGDDPVKAIVDYARQVYGKGRLRVIERTSGVENGVKFTEAAILVFAE